MTKPAHRAALGLALALLPGCGRELPIDQVGRVVRLAELEIDPAQIEPYKAALKEEIETSIRVEPGVLTLNAVAVKGSPTKIRIFEIYANEDAYTAHLRTPHFQKYKVGTQGMVRALNLVETEPVMLGEKRR